jgi:hypothetical protein
MNFATRFLSSPTHFPSSAQGQPWGNGEFAIALPGGPYRITGLDEFQLRSVESHLGELCRGESAAMEIRVFRASPEWFRHVNFEGRVAGLGFLGRLEFAPKAVASLWLHNGERLVEEGILENFLRFVLAYRVLQAGGILLHSAAVVKHGFANLFFGRSGAGKSTISRMGLKLGLDVLSDDMNAIMPGGDGYFAEKLPFAGDLGQTATPKGRYPLHGIYRLVQSPDNQVEALSPAVAVAALVACAPFVNADPHRAAQLAGNLERLVSQVLVRQLRFNTDGKVWDMI